MRADKKLLQWKQENMDAAFQDVTEAGMSISRAAKRHNVPRMTLSDRVHGNKSLKSQIGRKCALSEAEEASLVHYIRYMYQHRFPVTKTQVQGLAWAIDKTRPPENQVFGEGGPSLHWWRGFRDRHSDLMLRKPESVSRGRVQNATQENIDDYFETLKDIIETNSIEPQAIYNCDEAAIFLSKAVDKVVVPRHAKHCHTVVKSGSEHTSVLCCVNAAEQALPPLIVFSKCLPSLRGFAQQGPINASYSSSESGFVNREIYTQWFQKTFLPHASSFRPLLLIQDGATAHISIELIESAIANNVILLCLPSKLTHILQPCDVSVFKRMRGETKKVMQTVKMLRGDLWVTKAKLPAVLKEILMNTFIPKVITNGFQKSGIYPLNRDAIQHDLLVNGNESMNDTTEITECDVSSIEEQKTEQSQQRTDLNVISDICLEVVNEIPPCAEVVLDGSSSQHTEDTKSGCQATATQCPPALALKAVEASLTPRKKSAYERAFREGAIKAKDPVYTTWAYLKETSEMPPKPPIHPLVDAGLISQELADVLLPPTHQDKERIIRRKSQKSQVLTSGDLLDELKQKDEEKRLKLKRKDEKKRNKCSAKIQKLLPDAPISDNRDRVIVKQESGKKSVKDTKSNTTKQRVSRDRTKQAERKRRNRQAKLQKKTKDTRPSRQKCPIMKYDMIPTERERYFHHLQATLSCCSSLSAMKRILPEEIPYQLNISTPTSNFQEDPVAQILLSTTGLTDLTAAAVAADGNCLLRAASLLISGNESMYNELRICVAVELIRHPDVYTNDEFLSAHGASGTAQRYAMYSGHFDSQMNTKSIYEKDVCDTIKNAKYCGIWQLHGLASVLGMVVHSVYPGLGPPKKDLNRRIVPREIRHSREISIMWTHTTNSDVKTWWQPNHFVPLLTSPEVIQLTFHEHIDRRRVGAFPMDTWRHYYVKTTSQCRLT